MGSDWGEFWRRIPRFNWFGHQSLFDLIPTFVVPCMTGHLPAFSSVFASMFLSDPVPVLGAGRYWSHAGAENSRGRTRLFAGNSISTPRKFWRPHEMPPEDVLLLFEVGAF